jgi:RHS repeat-associated protein
VPQSTYSYDSNGNLTSGAGWGYTWDYLNRMLSAGFGNSTTTYAYDPAGNRVLQTSTTSTTFYPNKFYSFTSTILGATTTATSTNYIWNGDTLLATIDQPMINGSATGTPIIRYIHPDHLGSTNAVTDQNGSLVQLMDYYPYGATRIATSTYPTNEKRQYIGQFSDAQTNLSYLNARYYSSSRGQFLSEDPTYWGTQNILDPQSLNAYSYAENNPIVNKDPSGRCLEDGCIIEAAASLGFFGGIGVQAYHDTMSGDWRTRSLWGNIKTYGVAGGSGAVIAGGTAGAGVLAALAEFGTISTGIVAGGTSGILTNRVELGGNYLLGQPTDPYQSLVDTGIATFGAGFLSFLPSVSGRLPQSLSSALAITTQAHAARSAAEEFVSDSAQIFGSSLYQLYSNSAQQRSSAASSINSTLGYSTGGSSGGGSSMPSANSLWTTPSGAVVTWGGSLVVGPIANSTPARK